MGILSVTRAAIVAALPAALLLASCSGGDGSDEVNSVSGQSVAAFAAAAASRYTTMGVDGLYDLVDSGIRATCSRESFVQAVSDEQVAGAYLRLKDVSFQGESAKAKIDFQSQNGEITVEWELVARGNGSWAITHVPGMEDCTS